MALIYRMLLMIRLSIRGYKSQRGSTEARPCRRRRLETQAQERTRTAGRGRERCERDRARVRAVLAAGAPGAGAGAGTGAGEGAGEGEGGRGLRDPRGPATTSLVPRAAANRSVAFSATFSS